MTWTGGLGQPVPQCPMKLRELGNHLQEGKRMRFSIWSWMWLSNVIDMGKTLGKSWENHGKSHLVGGFKHEWIIVHVIYGMSSETHWRTHIFKMVKNHQPECYWHYSWYFCAYCRCYYLWSSLWLMITVFFHIWLMISMMILRG